jgi:hypothetical protein
LICGALGFASLKLRFWSELYLSIPNNFKYHSIEDLEELIKNLKNEIDFAEGRTNDHVELYPDLKDIITDIDQRKLKDSKEMLRDAEYEILERTLLNS